MKFLTLIILMISIAATFIPCCEFDDCQDDISTSSRQEQDESCSPFSICPTCSTAIVITKTIELSKSEITKNKSWEIETTSILASYSSSFWQPPRVELQS